MIHEIEEISKTMQIFVLDQRTKNEIKGLLEQELSKCFAGNELDEYVELGLDSRLCDLEHTIDIYGLKTIKVY